MYIHHEKNRSFIARCGWAQGWMDLCAKNPIKHAHLRQGGRSKPPEHSFSGWSTVETTWQWEGGGEGGEVSTCMQRTECPSVWTVCDDLGGYRITSISVCYGRGAYTLLRAAAAECCKRTSHHKECKAISPRYHRNRSKSKRQRERERGRERGKGFGTDEDTTIRTGRVRHEDTVRVGYFHGCYIFSWAIREKFLFLLTFLIGNVPFPPPPGPSCLSRCCCCCCGRKDMDEGRSWLAGQTEGGKDD